MLGGCSLGSILRTLTTGQDPTKGLWMEWLLFNVLLERQVVGVGG